MTSIRKPVPGQDDRETGPGGFTIEKGFNIKNLDQDLVKKAQGGKFWGPEDQARYDALVRAKAVKSNSKQNSVDQSITGEADSAPSNSVIKSYYKPPSVAKGEATNNQEQNVNQDNDINTTITGDKNTVINDQDNSIRQYGGDNRSFVYNGGQGGNKYENTPASMATLSGFYAPDDSPAANGFNDRYATMNRDNQKRYAGEAMKTFAKYGNIDARSYTDESMEALNRSTLLLRPC